MQVNIKALWYDGAIEELTGNKDVKSLENGVFQNKNISMKISITCNNFDNLAVINLIILG